MNPVQGTISAQQSGFKMETWLPSHQIIRTWAVIQSSAPSNFYTAFISFSL